MILQEAVAGAAEVVVVVAAEVVAVVAVAVVVAEAVAAGAAGAVVAAEAAPIHQLVPVASTCIQPSPILPHLAEPRLRSSRLVLEAELRSAPASSATPRMRPAC